MSELAINSGEKIRNKPFPRQLTVGKNEIDAVVKVMEGGILSGYRGSWNDAFFGGPEVKKLEREWAELHNVEHAISVNSATSGLQVACGAIGLKPGDEVIVTPWSMSCSATAPLVWGAIPVFADIEHSYYCLDPESIKSKITKKTKAIIVVSLFGQPYNYEAINKIAKEHNLFIIEDAAQALMSEGEVEEANGLVHRKYAGTFGDIGVFSFTQGKHLTCGEGGMIITDNANLAQRCRLIRNHAEAVIQGMDETALSRLGDGIDNNMLGYNMRMTEINAAIINSLISKRESILMRDMEDVVIQPKQSTLDAYVQMRRENAEFIYNALSDIPAIKASPIRKNCTHSFYVQAFHWDSTQADGLHRDKFIQAVRAELVPDEGREAEGVPIGCGYIQPLYLFPLFQRRKLYGHIDFPFNFYTGNGTKLEENYKEGSCPTAEKLWKDELFLSLYHRCPLTHEDRMDVVNAFHKVWENKEELL